MAAGHLAAPADISASAAFTLSAAPAPAPLASAQPRETAAPAPDRALDLAGDAAWLDRLARDIAQAAGNEGTIRFRLHPQTLGHLRVELSQGDHGTSVRLTADTEQARSILADAQPRLVAEARAQGVRIAESHVDLSGSDRSFSDDPRRQEATSQTPMIRTARDAAAGEDAPERPGRSRSDRYA
jgi:flagellar hook-length control protein FliK